MYHKFHAYLSRAFLIWSKFAIRHWCCGGRKTVRFYRQFTFHQFYICAAAIHSFTTVFTHSNTCIAVLQMARVWATTDELLDPKDTLSGEIKNRGRLRTFKSDQLAAVPDLLNPNPGIERTRSDCAHLLTLPKATDKVKTAEKAGLDTLLSLLSHENGTVRLMANAVVNQLIHLGCSTQKVADFFLIVWFRAFWSGDVELRRFFEAVWDHSTQERWCSKKRFAHPSYSRRLPWCACLKCIFGDDHVNWFLVSSESHSSIMKCFTPQKIVLFTRSENSEIQAAGALLIGNLANDGNLSRFILHDSSDDIMWQQK